MPSRPSTPLQPSPPATFSPPPRCYPRQQLQGGLQVPFLQPSPPRPPHCYLLPSSQVSSRAVTSRCPSSAPWTTCLTSRVDSQGTCQRTRTDPTSSSSEKRGGRSGQRRTRGAGCAAQGRTIQCPWHSAFAHSYSLSCTPNEPSPPSCAPTHTQGVVFLPEPAHDPLGQQQPSPH